MLNAIWLSMMLIAVICGTLLGRLDQVVQSITDSAKLSMELVIGLAGIMTLWLGMMNIAYKSNLIRIIERSLHPIMRWLFPEIPGHDPALGAMVMNIAANMLGLTNAATPFGLQAMKELQRLNTHVHTASNSMCMFLAINTSSVQLIPTTAIAYLAINGSHAPSNIVVSALLATIISTITAIVMAKWFSTWRLFRIKEI